MFSQFHNHFGEHEHGSGHGMAERFLRRRFGRGRGAFGDFGPFGGRRGGFGGRKIGSEDLADLLLSLLADKPSYGYELIKALEERSAGFYVPSPGMIYPALTYLEELELATVELDGSRKRYRITDAGTARLTERRAAVDEILERLQRIGSRMDDVRRAMGVDDDGSEHQSLHAARHALRAAVFAKRRASTAVRERIAEIIQRAASEIAALET